MNTRKTLSALLVGVVLHLSFFHSTALANPEEEKLAAKVKAGIAKLGTGKKSLVKVTLRDKSKIAGYVSEISQDKFTVVNEQTSSSTKIPYTQVKQVKGNNLSKGATIAVAVGFIVAMGILFALVWD